MTKLILRAAALLALALFASCLFSQTNAGQIVGTITDQRSAPLEGVKITATNLATNVQQIAVSSLWHESFSRNRLFGRRDCQSRS